MALLMAHHGFCCDEQHPVGSLQKWKHVHLISEDGPISFKGPQFRNDLQGYRELNQHG